MLADNEIRFGIWFMYGVEFMSQDVVTIHLGFRKVENKATDWPPRVFYVTLFYVTHPSSCILSCKIPSD